MHIKVYKEILKNVTGNNYLISQTKLMNSQVRYLNMRGKTDVLNLKTVLKQHLF